MTNILVAIACYGGNMKVQCAVSLVALCSNFAARGVLFEIRYRDSADIAANRNHLASIALSQPERTHLLFVDSDMEFRPQTVFRMLQLDRPIIGCVYPKRRPLSSSLEDFVVNVGNQTRLHVLNGICQVAGVGMGLTLVHRTVLEQMVGTGELRQWRPDRSAPLHYGFFDPIATKSSYTSEDLSFCNRWTELCNGEICALVDEEIGHVGEFTYKARLLDHVGGMRDDSNQKPLS
ncbi:MULTISPECIES: hypothetical protein [unclassified Mesorhizobium]|uniref:hypothetical protein n=1 Tax=unclassified Mesorhizobium TaxID=325217 RepID=UPI000F753241|nr:MULTISPECIES: hypothetical protein [unclassified Mesorhizobium]AZO15241.1 hypothetical protein EJ069_11165 [Mesorhizobium sp. M2A.F.Ca.ET.043.05.1.1]RWD68766.1 MAG: hypothetical protein EOS37_20140 [Mesorhizobium sp.]TIV59950.1 MAG: hypothetical protein E5V80_11820 [Mesorhizobium sp.]